MYWMEGEGRAIVLNASLGARQRYETKVHELMHDKYTCFDLVTAPAEARRMEEARVKRWEIEYLMPVDSLIEAFRMGCTTPLDLADFLGITVEKLHEGIRLYNGVYGPRSTHGQYVVNWDPFWVKRDKRRKDAP
jgi:hypothetical protein